MLCCDWLFFNSPDWRISILAVSLSDLLPRRSALHGFPVVVFFCFFLFRDSPKVSLVDGKENKSFEFSEWTVKVQLYEICDSVSTSISFITPPLTFGKLKNIDIAAGKVSAQPHTIVKQICFPNGDVSFFSLFSLFKN